MRQKSLFNTPETIKEQVLHINKTIKELEQDRRDLQDVCEHPDEFVDKKGWGNSGNYDPSQDCYGTDYHCKICDARWQFNTHMECPECGKNHKGAIKGCDMVYGRRGWRQLGVYDG